MCKNSKYRSNKKYKLSLNVSLKNSLLDNFQG